MLGYGYDIAIGVLIRGRGIRLSRAKRGILFINYVCEFRINIKTSPSVQKRNTLIEQRRAWVCVINVGHQCKGKFLHSSFVGVEDEMWGLGNEEQYQEVIVLKELS